MCLCVTTYSANGQKASLFLYYLSQREDGSPNSKGLLCCIRTKKCEVCSEANRNRWGFTWSVSVLVRQNYSRLAAQRQRGCTKADRQYNNRQATQQQAGNTTMGHNVKNRKMGQTPWRRDVFPWENPLVTCFRRKTPWRRVSTENPLDTLG